ncbi:hypothetical protein AA12717_2478 [Gluconacetobacter sacchari DSM 12717]|nr:hypothetical protein [Gluconacetobacter sacchari]GBQ26810.1 hypothetical protein AA12717_2478 [Gluconacetobacter sacchari DSM 12717]
MMDGQERGEARQVDGARHEERDHGAEMPEVAAAPVAVDAEVEDQARRMGWVPREEFRGDGEKWRPARDFLDRGMTLLPVLQQQYRALDGRYATMQAQLRDSQKALADLTDRTRRADERAYQRAVRDIESRRQAAVASGDTTAFAVAERDLQDLRETAPPAVPTAPAAAAAPVERVEAMPSEIMAFVQANPWFSSHAEARQDAIAIQSAVDRQHPELSLAERLEITRRKVRQLHPALFENRRREAPPPVSPSRGEGARGGNPRGFDALPAEARREYDRYARALAGKGKPLTKDEWAGYYWENEA